MDGAACRSSGGCAMEKIEGKTLRGQKITLDDKELVNCRLIDCELTYQGNGSIRWIGNKFENCSFALGPSAERTVAFLRLLYREGAHDVLRGMLPEIFAKH